MEKALQLNPDLAEAHGAKALIAMNSNDNVTAMTETQRALELNPVYVDAMNWLQIATGNFGDYQAALEIQQRMIEVDPLSVIGRLNYSPVLATFDLEAGIGMANELSEKNAWAGNAALGQIYMQILSSLSSAVGHFMQAYGADPQDEFTNRYLITLLAQVGLYEEARRISDGHLFLVDLQEGQLETAIHSLQKAHAGDPENFAPMTDLADALHRAGRFEESQQLYEQLIKLSPTGIVFDNLDLSSRPTLRIAFVYKKSGNEAAAVKVIESHRLDQEKRLAVGLYYYYDHLAEAMAQSILGDSAGAFTSIRKAIDTGFRDHTFFNEPAMQWLSDHPEYIALKAEVNNLLAMERKEILQLICHENPIPDIWQPMNKTCAGVLPGV
jgi:tetratricopeptide (TPR) repeat protein